MCLVAFIFGNEVMIKRARALKEDYGRSHHFLQAKAQKKMKDTHLPGVALLETKQCLGKDRYEFFQF